MFCCSGCGGTGLSDTPDSDRGSVDPGGMSRAPLDRPCMVMLLRKENALHHIASLIEAFMVQLSLNNTLSESLVVHSTVSLNNTLSESLVVHSTVSLNNTLSESLVVHSTVSQRHAQ